jgi:hypothetical protein
MLSAANTTLDLLVLELVLELILCVALLLGVLAPVEARSEDDVLANGCGIGSWASAVLGALAEFAPCFSVGYAGVDGLLVGDVADSAGELDLVSVLVDAERDDGLGSVLVGDGLGGREVGGGLLDVIIVGPVVPSRRLDMFLEGMSKKCGRSG